MFAMFVTLAFLAIAGLAMAVITASLAKGFAAASMLRRQLALVDDVQMVTVRRERPSRVRLTATVRPSRRALRPAPALAAPARQRAVA
jgi:hypothetical protein